MKVYGEEVVYDKESIPSILKWVESNSRILEFGPAYGYMTRYMKEYLNCNVTCIELNPEMKPILEQYAEKVIIADLDDCTWEQEISGKFDFIIFGDVLEHLRYPQKVMEIAILFGDCVLTSIPNIAHSSIILGLLNGDFTYRNLGLLDDTHIHFFTRKSIYEMMNSLNMYSVEENNSIKLYPSATEFHRPYLKNWCTALSIIHKPDTSVYQFVNKWVRSDIKIKDCRGYRIPIYLVPKVLLLDTLRYFVDNFNLRSAYLQKIWFKIK